MFQHYGILNLENYLNHGILGYIITVLRQVYMDNSPTHTKRQTWYLTSENDLNQGSLSPQTVVEHDVFGI